MPNNSAKHRQNVFNKACKNINKMVNKIVFVKNVLLSFPLMLVHRIANKIGLIKKTLTKNIENKLTLYLLKLK